MKRLFAAGLWVEAVVLAVLVCGSACSSSDAASNSSPPPRAAASGGGAAAPHSTAVPPSQGGAGAGGDTAQHSSAGSPAQAGAGAGGAAGPEAPEPAGGAAEDCAAFEVVGLQYSPGGDVLPNTCKPFDSLTNNPYAIRCIDAMPEFGTKFLGDDYCILPPPPEQGFQVGVHPLGNAEYWERMWAGDFSFYDDPAVTKPYELAAGDETVQNYNAVIDGVTSDRFFYRRQFRGRYGSHHGMVRFAPSTVTEDRWLDSGDVLLTTPEIITLNNAYLDYPQHVLEVPPEEEGVGYRASNTGAFFNLHHFNTTDQPTLRENWVNVWYVPADQVTKEALYFVAQAPIDYPPGMVLDSPGSVLATAETHVLSMVAHRHAWTTRLHAWVVRAGSTREELVYDSYDWGDMPTFSYNSRVMNPPPGQGVDGATSGPLVLYAGDVLHFNCHVDTTEKRAAELGVAAPPTTLRFGNQAFDAEMCLLNGHTTGTRLGFGF